MCHTCWPRRAIFDVKCTHFVQNVLSRSVYDPELLLLVSEEALPPGAIVCVCAVRRGAR